MAPDVGRGGGVKDRQREFWRNRPAPGPRLFALATAVCFGGALFAFPIRPWGHSAAIALMSAWVTLAFYCVLREAGLNGGLYGPRIRRRRSQVILRLLVGVAPLAFVAYLFILEHQGKSSAVVRDYWSGFWLVFIGAQVVQWLIDRIYEGLTRAKLLRPIAPPTCEG